MKTEGKVRKRNDWTLVRVLDVLPTFCAGLAFVDVLFVHGWAFVGDEFSVILVLAVTVLSLLSIIVSVIAPENRRLQSLRPINWLNVAWLAIGSFLMFLVVTFSLVSRGG